MQAPDDDDAVSESKPSPKVTVASKPQPSVIIRRSLRRLPGPATRYRDSPSYVMIPTSIEASSFQAEVTKTVEKAMQSPIGGDWINAMRDEMDSLIFRQVFLVKNPPVGRKLVSNKWLFDFQCNEYGNVKHYKARFVARGLSQIDGVAYDEIYSPVTRYDSFRLLMGIVASYDFEMNQVDIKTAWIYKKLDKDTFMAPPVLPDVLCRFYSNLAWNV